MAYVTIQAGIQNHNRNHGNVNFMIVLLLADKKEQSLNRGRSICLIKLRYLWRHVGFKTCADRNTVQISQLDLDRRGSSAATMVYSAEKVYNG